VSANPLRPLPDERFDYWNAHHLLVRAGFGGVPAEVRALKDLGVAKAVASLVDYASASNDADEPAWEPSIMRPPTPEEREAERRARAGNDEETLARLQRERQMREGRDREQLARAQQWWMGRFLRSGRPLEEKLTLFWHGHFATGYRTIEDSWHMLAQQRLFRGQANGSFETLVRGIVRDPAMLEYLDNDENRRGSPNENLARELMELFVLGEGNGYTERDIKEGARALTGYTFVDDEFVFDVAQHDPTPKEIFGTRGPFDGDAFAQLVLKQRGASEWIALKLYRHFVNDVPGRVPDDRREVVKALARELKKADFNLKPMLTALFRSEHFYDESNRAQVIKSPVQLIAQTVRSYGTPTRSLPSLVSAADLMGQHLFQPPNVKGWEGGRAWINTSTYFVRQNVAVYLLTGQRPRQFDWEASSDPYDATHLVRDLREAAGGDPAPEDVATFLLRFSLASTPHPTRVESLAGFLRQTAGAPENDRIKGALALITALPEYQVS
jgi:uncharacterized protein (DUF1800 family)